VSGLLSEIFSNAFYSQGLKIYCCYYRALSPVKINVFISETRIFLLYNIAINCTAKRLQLTSNNRLVSLSVQENTIIF
jgi:hypothetical protein